MEYVTQLAHIVRVCLVVDGVAILMAIHREPSHALQHRIFESTTASMGLRG